MTFKQSLLTRTWALSLSLALWFTDLYFHLLIYLYENSLFLCSPSTHTHMHFPSKAKTCWRHIRMSTNSLMIWLYCKSLSIGHLKAIRFTRLISNSLIHSLFFCFPVSYSLSHKARVCLHLSPHGHDWHQWEFTLHTFWWTVYSLYTEVPLVSKNLFFMMKVGQNNTW